MKILYVGGCSWSRDTLNKLELPQWDGNNSIHNYKDNQYGEPFLWCNHLAKKLSYRLINHATGGGSNDRIFRKTTDFLMRQKFKDLFVILQFTWAERLEYINDDGIFENLNWEEDTGVYKYFLNNHSEKYFIKKSTHIVINLHKHLKSIGVNHLFFFSSLMLKQEFDKKYITKYIDKNNFILDISFEETQVDYIKKGDIHPGKQSHINMAEIIYNKLKDEKTFKEH